ncbi:O-antigen ligase family protein [Oricola cellulosilytica]|uniref:O-antigen ligase family protein n=1 Tax=Oricola cellulosilytica TaxID=1429082 RepID=A0A4R0PFF3_9HYPH|nr:O-antigen ligase [Oricola cellulosilytica]TCD16567.1 O-antigen ligase family protein [Oricola cellulosilytica]
MNNIAIPRRTEAGFTPRRGVEVRSLLAFAVLAVAWISFSPFDVASLSDTESASDGKLINQIGYTAVSAAAVLALLTMTGREVASRMLSLGWIAMFVLLVISGYTAADPDDAVRSTLFTIIATVMAATAFALPNNARALSAALATACAAVLILSYAGVLIYPEAAIHTAEGVEANHSGLWRGIFTHKNTAGPVMAAIAFSGIYLTRRGWRLPGAIIALAAIVFVWNTGSKTSTALVPAIIVLVMVPSLVGMRFLAASAIIFSVVSIYALTIGTVFVPSFDAILRGFNETTTFTGRIEIWEFARDFVTRHPWTGFGYDSFWGEAVTENAEQAFDSTWDPRGIVHGHSGFLDVTLFMGLPALFLSVWLLLLAPLWQYLRTPPFRENVLLADLCLMIVSFMIMNSAMESYFFRRADPIWLTLVAALFGLRLCSRFKLRSE